MSSATQRVGLGRSALFTSSNERPFQLRRGQVGPVVERLQERIAALVRHRQRMRASRAGRASLERNRLQLVRSQWELSHALIERHLPMPPEKTR
jgi:hypothetical protein